MAEPTSDVAYDPTTDVGKVRLLVNDVDEANFVFSDKEIQTFLTLCSDAILLAAAQAIDTIADNEALASKVIRTQDLQTDGAKVADSLHKRAQSLRDQHAMQLEDEGFFQVIDESPCFDSDLIGWL